MTDDELIARKVNADTALMGILNENLYKDTAMAYDELMEKAKRIAAGDPTSFGRLEYQAIIRMLLAAEADNAALRKLLGKCRPAMELVLRDAVSLKLEGIAGVYQALLTEIDAAIDAARTK